MSTSPSDKDLETASIEAMERLDAEVTIDSEIGEIEDLSGDGSNEGDDELVTIKRDRAGEIRAFYAIDGQPDYFHFRTELRHSLDGDATTRTENDWHLKDAPPVEFFGKSQSFLARKFEDFETRSAYDKKSHTYEDFVEKYRPMHGSTEGGKGLAMYTRPVIYLTAEMSVINNVNVAMGCPASCSFCLPRYSSFNKSFGVDLKLVQPGDILPSPYGDVRVVSRVHTGEKEVLRYLAGDGTGFESTPDHPVLAHDGEGFLIVSAETAFTEGYKVVKM